MKHTLLALLGALTVSALPTMVHAEDAASPLTFNVSVTSDYRYRGMSQTRLKPALQGGADYDFGNGFYVGLWASTIKWIKDGGGDGEIEIDFYGGYKTELAKGLNLDVGVLQYAYPSNKLSPSANTTELYGALTFGVVTAKYSHSTSNLFGYPDSKQSGYLDVSAALDLGEGFTLTPHIGRQNVRHLSAASYTDYSLTLNKDYAGFTFGVAAVATSLDVFSAGKNLGKNGLVLSVKKAF